MYTGKLTMVRAYVRIYTGPSSINNISGAICLGDTGESGCSDPLRPIGPITLYKMADAVSFWRRPGAAYQELRGTLNFIIPDSWVSSPGKLTFTTYVNFNEENVDETVYDTNNWQLISAAVKKSAPLNVVFVQLAKYYVPFDSVWDLISYLKRTYPTGDIRVWSLPVLIDEVYDFADNSPPGCGPGWTRLLDHLEWWTKSYSQHYYAMLFRNAIQRFDFAAGKIYTGASGCGRRIGDYHREAGGIITPGSPLGGEIAAQEIGHNLGRMHSAGCGASFTDPSFSGFLEEYGVDVLLRRGYNESDYDFMGYCNAGSRWVSLYTYRALASLWYSAMFLPDTSPHAASAYPAENATEFLVGSGLVSPTHLEIQDGFYHLSLETIAESDPTTGPYSVELLDGTGQVLFSRKFSPVEDSNNDPISSGAFFLSLPWQENTQTLVFKFQGFEIGRVEASSHAPTIAVIEPSRQPTEDGDLTVRWEASDADGDALQYMLEYSRDGGSTWSTLAPNLLTTEFTIDPAVLPGSEEALFRIAATDGFNTAFAVSSVQLSIANKAPLVHIDGGVDNPSLQQGEPVTLLGMGTDLEDGPFESEQFH